MANIEAFENNPERYDHWFEKNRLIYESELAAVKELLPPFSRGLEIGVGSGRFAAPLGITRGIEPSARMRAIARRRNIDAVDAVAESLPFPDKSFDLLLMVTTVCFLDDLAESFRQAYRVLMDAGSFLIGFIDKQSALGLEYLQKKNSSPFYRTAVFYSVSEIAGCLEESGFTCFQYRQTLFRPLRQITAPEPIKAGTGLGAFVVVRAMKNTQCVCPVY